MKISRKTCAIFITIVGFFVVFCNLRRNDRTNWFDDSAVILRTNDCDNYFESIPVLGVDEDFLSHEQKMISVATPLAFSHLLHEQASIFESFLSTHFRPNNYHCIHVDKKSNPTFKKAIINLVTCYSKRTLGGFIFTLPENETLSVDWGKNTMLKADLSCIRKLLQMRNNMVTLLGLIQFQLLEMNCRL